MREEFSCGIMAPPGTKKFTITDNSLIYGRDEYPYAKTGKITMVVAPSPITNGMAQVVINGQAKQLVYRFADRDRAAKAFDFANGKIDAAHGVVKNYKFRLQAHTGTSLEVYDTYLILTFMATGTMLANIAKGGANGGKRINFTDITAIQFKEPAGMSVGFIQFAFPGSGESKAGVVGAINDENSIPVQPTDVALARQIVDYIETRRVELKLPTTVVQQASAADELKKFKDLMDMGIITREEFEAKKKQLLDL